MEKIIGTKEMIVDNRKFTAWCGLCCLDCIPSNSKFFSLVQHLDDMMRELHFDDYAKLKSKNHPIFSQYPTFVQILKEIKSLPCAMPCREGGGKAGCEVRHCAKSKSYTGCWECAESKICELLEPLRAFHPNLDHHLRLIQEYGPENWLPKRRAHYWWQQDEPSE